MSAVVQINSFAYALRPKTELEVSLAVSRKIACSQNLWRTLDEVCQLVLDVRGVTSIDLDVPGVSFQPAIDSDGAIPPNAFSAADVSYGGVHWGAMKISFDAATAAVESPVRFAKFLGQQIGNLLSQSLLVHEVPRRRVQNQTLSQRLTTRKLHSRALSILCRYRGMTEVESRNFINSSARKLRRPIAYIADTVVAMDSDVFRIDWKRDRSLKDPLYRA